MENEKNGSPPDGRTWPEPRLKALQVDELYKFAPTAAGFSYLGALLTLGVLIETGDTGRGSVWFLWATAVTFFRFMTIVAYRRRSAGSSPEAWARLVIAANLLAGIQWGILGTLLFPEAGGYRQLFTIMVITCFVGGSLSAYSAVKGAHEALSIPATIPTAINLFFVQDGVHVFAGVTALFFTFAIVYYARKLNRQIEESLRAQIERDELLSLTGLLNEKLLRENRELAHRAAVRGMSVESARERAGRLETLFENSPLPQIECDAAGNVITCNLAAERLFGMRHEALVAKPFASLLAGPYAAGKAFAGARNPMNVEVQVRAQGGEALTCTASFTPLPAAEGRKAGFAVILCGLTIPADVK
ncbi:MAG: PAS domain S-box protein [Usitatibacter sp.]